MDTVVPVERNRRKRSLSIIKNSTKFSPWYRDRNNLRFFGMFFLTGGFFLVELIGGLLFGSLALLADSFHMLSDIIALSIGFYAMNLSKKSRTSHASFGWERAEVIGALVNGSFLLAMCFSITLEAVHRFIDWWPTPDKNISQFEIVKNSDSLIIISAVGLGINIVGLFLFGHSHGGHSHGGENHSHINIRGVFLHILGDALGSIGALLSNLLIKFLDSPYRVLSDPSVSFFIVFILISVAVPLIKKCISILMEKAPKNVDIEKLKKEIVKIEGIIDVHDLHIWSLTSNKIFGTLHITVDNRYEVMKIFDLVKNIMHENGIHSSTVQPELVDITANIEGCEDLICENPICSKVQCCK